MVTSNAAKCSLSWTAVAIPAWCTPWNGTAAPLSAAGDGVVLRAHRGDRATGRDRAERQPGTAPAEQRTARRGAAAGGVRFGGARVGDVRPGGVLALLGHDRCLPARYFVTAAASCDSGSASALTASDSSLRSALPTFSYEVNS